ncbi:unnamed protein product [Microthlaspi erraticum]|uniref:Reverse transcriptase Ty1/copia-type domain-containing protein n=1 Tax=Microthlaspi erraticum TaxID=1685480 RepID=A0A6D2IDT9_9BRAS|nr:unnamed protein product [Microthlaspi erraticum]
MARRQSDCLTKYLLNTYATPFQCVAAPRAWNKRFATHACNIGFKQSITDPSLFILCHNNEIAYLLLYVDDIALTESSMPLLNCIISALASEFEMTDMGILQYFLGISFKRDHQGLFLQQQNYAADILHRAGMTDCNPCLTPCDTKSKLAAADHLCTRLRI